MFSGKNHDNILNSSPQIYMRNSQPTGLPNLYLDGCAEDCRLGVATGQVCATGKSRPQSDGEIFLPWRPCRVETSDKPKASHHNPCVTSGFCPLGLGWIPHVCATTYKTMPISLSMINATRAEPRASLSSGCQGGLKPCPSTHGQGTKNI